MNGCLVILKALADQTRLNLVNLLLRHDLCVGALAHRLGISQAAVSQHLRILRRAGLIRGEKRGYWTHYAVEKDVLAHAAEELGTMAAQQSYTAPACGRALFAKDPVFREEVKDMCKRCCEQPEKLKGKPEECTPDQIRECHGEVKDHPCEEDNKEG